MTDRRFAFWLTAAFLVLAGAVMARHEMWRDEVQPFLIARHSASLPLLVSNLRMEVHPALWYILLYGLNCLTNSLHAMQLLHLAIGGAVVFLFSRHAPFSRLHKVLFPFGYLVFYEYTVITRSYSLGILLIVLLCILFADRYARFPWCAIICALLANTSFVGLIIAAAFGISLAIESLRGRPQAPGAASPAGLAIGYALIAAGCLLGAVQCQTPDETPMVFLARLRLSPTLSPWAEEALCSVCYGFFPLQLRVVEFWDTNVLTSCPPLSRIAPSLAIVAYMSALLLRNRTVLLFYLISTLGMGLSFFLCGGAFYRHYGYHYIVTIAAVWMMRRDAGVWWPRAAPLRRMSAAAAASLPTVLTLILCAQALCAVYPVAVDLAHPFSCAPEAAEWIRKSGAASWTLVGYQCDTLGSLVGHLDARVYSIPYERFLYFPSQASQGVEGGREVSLGEREDFLRTLPRIRKRLGDDVLVVFSDPLPDPAAARFDLVEVARFRGAIAPREDFYLYVFRGVRTPLAPAKRGPGSA